MSKVKTGPYTVVGPSIMIGLDGTTITEPNHVNRVLYPVDIRVQRDDQSYIEIGELMDRFEQYRKFFEKNGGHDLEQLNASF